MKRMNKNDNKNRLLFFQFKFGSTAHLDFHPDLIITGFIQRIVSMVRCIELKILTSGRDLVQNKNNNKFFIFGYTPLYFIIIFFFYDNFEKCMLCRVKQTRNYFYYYKIKFKTESFSQVHKIRKPEIHFVKVCRTAKFF